MDFIAILSIFVLANHPLQGERGARHRRGVEGYQRVRKGFGGWVSD